ncbi:tubulointerstitial nephritis antigen-like [Electrophorus electricus]|uniref:tubulointerstitial nephritis antigen-like n=1 Tax=Electrophorus electricus TaxID=8005 RepID=UPI0015D03597|nr:tubulointerstitial nephritis antigen-like [Electrophorus electricus]
MRLVVVVAVATVLLLLVEGGMTARTRRELASPLHGSGIQDPYGSYCQRRGGCCPGRDDQCTVPYLDTICYCDLFCNRTVSDCCPDFWGHCLGIRPPHLGVCERNGHTGATYKKNCNLCTCGPSGQWDCEQNACLIEDDMIQAVNRGNHGWRAGNYSQFWGMTLDEGLRYRLGTKHPSRATMSMNEIQMNMDSNEHPPTYFNAADKWPGKIHEPLDQGNCAASWAFSTAAVASDRISIQSMGHMTPQLSPQNLISCDTRNQGGCAGGRIDGAWWYLRRRGVVTEECYPFSAPQHSPADGARCMMQSRSVGRGKRQATARCPNSHIYHNDIYQSTPPYRLSSHEKEIMKEIMNNGPVQAILEVHEDFFIYKSGIYRHTDINVHKASQYRKHGTHSVRITGWGEEKDYNGKTRKYWIAANSWGKNWGEDGYFRIARGENECEIEAFVIGVWGRITMEDMHNHHHHLHHQHHGRLK